MPDLSVLFTMDCEAIRSMSSEGGPETWDAARRSIEGFCRRLLGHGLKPTLFIVPAAARHLGAFLVEMGRAGAELGLHFHPQDHGHADYLGGFTGPQQEAMLAEAVAAWSDALGVSPGSFRGGNFSANDATFPVLAGLGMRQGSLSVPDRCFTRVRSNWSGSPSQAFHPSRANRPVPGDLDFLEVPVTADWESIMWGGLTRLELRLEMVDARSHGFTVRKNVDRQLAAGASRPYLLAMTHDIFDFSDPVEFRTQVLEGVISEIRACAEQRGLRMAGPTLQDYHRLVDAG